MASSSSRKRVREIDQLSAVSQAVKKLPVLFALCLQLYSRFSISSLFRLPIVLGTTPLKLFLDISM
jgi:hypothetical protein